MTAEDSLKRVEELMTRLEQARARLEQTDDPQQAVEILSELSEIAKAVEAEIQRAKQGADRADS